MNCVEATGIGATWTGNGGVADQSEPPRSQSIPGGTQFGWSFAFRKADRPTTRRTFFVFLAPPLGAMVSSFAPRWSRGPGRQAALRTEWWGAEPVAGVVIDDDSRKLSRNRSPKTRPLKISSIQISLTHNRLRHGHARVVSRDGTSARARAGAAVFASGTSPRRLESPCRRDHTRGRRDTTERRHLERA